MELRDTHYIRVDQDGKSKVACAFFAPNQEAAIIMARAYVRSLVAHTKGLSWAVKKEQCKLFRKT